LNNFNNTTTQQHNNIVEKNMTRTDNYYGAILFASVTTALKLGATFFTLAKKAPTIRMQKSVKNENLLQQVESIFNFRPTPLYALDYYGQLQTVCQTILRETARMFSRISYRRELLLLSDNGTVGLDWVETYKSEKILLPSNAPIVVIMHGLCGDSNAEYLVHLVEVLTSAGYRVVVMVARGCGGVPLTTPVPFNGARVLDFKEAINRVHKLYPSAQIFAMGFSLGACLLVRYMSEVGEDTPVVGAIAVSPPWDFQIKGALCFDLIWTKLLNFLLKFYAIKNFSAFQDHFLSIMLTSSIRDFDSICCSMSGYKDVNEYYDDCSIWKVLHRVSKPTLVVSSVDDPICNIEGCPRDISLYGPGIITVIVEHGGHLGFAEHVLPLNSSWIDRLSLDWFTALSSQS
jgi:predicted alpha/beta-fold hydrolase